MPRDPAVRRGYLREYLVAAVADNVLSWKDLAEAGPERAFRAMTADLVEVLRDLGRSGAGNGARMLGALLMQFGESLSRPPGRKP